MGLMTGNIPALVAKFGASVDVERSTPTEDDLGGRDRVWITQSSGVSVSVQPAPFTSVSAQMVEEYAQRNITITHRVYFATAPGVQMGDRLLFGTRYLLVEGVSNRAESSELWYVDCREVEAAT